MDDHCLSLHLSGRCVYDYRFLFHLTGRRVYYYRFFLHLSWRSVDDHRFCSRWRGIHNDSFCSGWGDMHNHRFCSGWRGVYDYRFGPGVDVTGWRMDYYWAGRRRRVNHHDRFRRPDNDHRRMNNGWMHDNLSWSRGRNAHDAHATMVTGVNDTSSAG
jgi:hypothetical protein